MTDYLYKALRVSKYSGIDVVGFKEETSGVLKGQTILHFIGNYETEELARQAHPDAGQYVSMFTSPRVSLNHLPDENDPVPGGMYPDDYDDGI